MYLDGCATISQQVISPVRQVFIVVERILSFLRKTIIRA